MLVGIETGGTKIVALLAADASPEGVLEQRQIPTSTPETTGRQLRRQLEAWNAFGQIDAIGLAAFGPVDLDPASVTFGTIQATTKPSWSGTDLRELLGASAPVGIVSDVTGAALAESRWGAADGDRTVVYVTVGTGVGAGIVVDSRPAGAAHPELGHLIVRRHPEDPFAGNCPFHGDCAEGLAAGPAIAARWGRTPTELGDARAQAIEMAAWYIGEVLAATSFCYAPDRIVLGGGILKLPGIRAAAERHLHRALGHALDGRPPARPGFVVAPGLGDRAGALGALAVASDVERRRPGGRRTA
ncbi:ROK family protein [Agromyces sp. ZXT2-3]|uniref:ROK family protein n=1 Tax=Agromyces sp. ZXT2-3 TaxID=3461152 RepID=UPI004054F4F8